MPIKASRPSPKLFQQLKALNSSKIRSSDIISFRQGKIQARRGVHHLWGRVLFALKRVFRQTSSSWAEHCQTRHQREIIQLAERSPSLIKEKLLNQINHKGVVTKEFLGHCIEEFDAFFQSPEKTGSLLLESVIQRASSLKFGQLKASITSELNSDASDFPLFWRELQAVDLTQNMLSKIPRNFKITDHFISSLLEQIPAQTKAPKKHSLSEEETRIIESVIQVAQEDNKELLYQTESSLIIRNHIAHVLSCWQAEQKAQKMAPYLISPESAETRIRTQINNKELQTYQQLDDLEDEIDYVLHQWH